MSKLKNENIKYVMNLTESMVNKLITKVEASIIEEKSKQAVIQPELDKAKEEYDRIISQAKIAYESIHLKWLEHQDKITEEEHTLEALVKFKTHASTSKQIGVYTNISNTNKKTKRPKRFTFRWGKSAPEFLSKEKRFMDPTDLVVKIVESSDNEHKDQFSKVDRFKAVTYVKRQALDRKYNLVMFNDKIGLQDWMGSNGSSDSVKPEFLKQFMG